MLHQLMNFIKCQFNLLIAAVEAGNTAANTSMTPNGEHCVTVDGKPAQPASRFIIWDDIAQVIIGIKWVDSQGVELTGDIVKVDYCECLKTMTCCPPDTDANAFDLRDVDKTSETKFAFDSPGFSNAHGATGSSPWTTADLIANLNSSAAAATAANNASGIDYTTAVFGAHPTLADVVVVTAGPVPTTLDLVSMNVSLPVAAI